MRICFRMKGTSILLFYVLFLLLIANQLYPKLKAQHIMCQIYRLTVVVNQMCLLKLICCVFVSQNTFSTVQTKRLFVLFLVAWHQYHGALLKSMDKWKSVVLFQCNVLGVELTAKLYFCSLYSNEFVQMTIKN